MTKFVYLVIMLFFYIFCIVGSSPSIADESQQFNAEANISLTNIMLAQEQNGKKIATPQNTTDLKAYVDPETGELITPAQRKARAVEKITPSADFNTSHEGLVESVSPEPGGGVMIDLKGRFRTPMTATKDSNGKIKIDHQVCD